MSERWDLRLGRWQDALADVECDALICDPPYSDKTHKGHNKADGPDAPRVAISYSHWTAEDVARFVDCWSERTRGWIAAMTSHDLIPAWEEAHRAANRYVFAPVPCVISGMGVRLMGDGPSSEVVYLVVARPRAKRFLKWGTLPDFYYSTRQAGSGGGRGKPLDLMKAIVRDYSRPGDLICDPTAGLATTGVAALTMGRRFVGSECDPETYTRAECRLGETQYVDLFDAGRATQESLL